MFSAIFKFELKRWFKSPAFYSYSFVFFALALFISIVALGIFDSSSTGSSSPLKLNSAISISSMLNSMTTFVYFLIPTIIGASVFRDYSSNMHHVLFSYPLKKDSYLFAKFSSSVLVTMIIVSCIAFGLIVAQYVPGINKERLGPTNLWVYFEVILITILPNILLVGTIVFGLVTFSRSIYVGFVFVLLLITFQSTLQLVANDSSNLYNIALMDPFGNSAITYLTQDWSIAELNTNRLPVYGVFAYNRMIWLAIAILLFLFVRHTFSFSQSAFSFKRKTDGQRFIKDNYGSISRIILPKVEYSYSFISNLKLSWRLSSFDFKFIVKNWTFIILIAVSMLFNIVTIYFYRQFIGIQTYPRTWQMFDAFGGIFSFFTQILIFLFSGILWNRAQSSRMNLLVDTTSTPNWVLYLSKVIALVKMVLTISLFSILIAMIYQTYLGYYHYQIDVYILKILLLDNLSYLVLISFALFIQSLFKNYMAGFMVCLLLIILFPILAKLGIEQQIFIFNKGTGFMYTDMNGFQFLAPFLIYRLYWLLFAVILSITTLLLYKRGVSSLKERFLGMSRHLVSAIYVPLLLVTIVFLSFGYWIYEQNKNTIPSVLLSAQETKAVKYEKDYSQFAHLTQPKIVATKVNLNIFPKEKKYDGQVEYVLKNSHQEAIDTIFVNYVSNMHTIQFDRSAKEIIADTSTMVSIYVLEQALLPGDSLLMTSVLENRSKTIFTESRSNLENGSCINNTVFPTIGYKRNLELKDNEIRKTHKLQTQEVNSPAMDMSAYTNNNDVIEDERIRFEAILSIADDQVAIAPGTLVKEWTEGNRKHYHYKMDQKIPNNYSIVSGDFDVMKEDFNGTSLEVYYHKDHPYNSENIIKSMKSTLAYFEQEFGTYPFRQLRIVEMPRYADILDDVFANVILISEADDFITYVDENDPEAVDYLFGSIANHIALQCWTNQFKGLQNKESIPMESLVEYTALKAMEYNYGRPMVQKLLQDHTNGYLKRHKYNAKTELPVIMSNQFYVNTEKGAVVFHALSEYIGEEKFHSFLRDYLSKDSLQQVPFNPRMLFVNELKANTPANIHYFIEDNLETITLYENNLAKVTSKKLAGNQYQVDIELNVSKYRLDDKKERSYKDSKGRLLNYQSNDLVIKSLPLSDYIEIAVFGEPTIKNGNSEENQLVCKQIHVTNIHNKLSILVDKEPFEVVIDPFNKLIDINANKKRKKILDR